MTPFAKLIVSAPWFQRLIIVAIILAGVLAGIETNADIVARHGSLLHALDGIVLGIFIVEVILKLASHSPQPWRYFRDGWNVFDFIVVALCCLPIHSQFAVVLRLVRTLRLLRLVTALPKLQMLVGALIKSFSSMGYVGMLLGLMFYIYAIMGVHLFGAHDAAHFGGLAVASLTLFQIITLDNWSDVFAVASGASPTAAAVYFVSFILLGTMIMLNLFIGVIMNSMSEMHEEIEAQEKTEHPNDGASNTKRHLAAIEHHLAALREALRSVDDRALASIGSTEQAQVHAGTGRTAARQSPITERITQPSTP